MCGPLAGGVGLMDSYLDTLFALKTLLAPDVSLVHLGDSLFDQIGALQAALEAAQATEEGRAKSPWPQPSATSRDGRTPTTPGPPPTTWKPSRRRNSST